MLKGSVIVERRFRTHEEAQAYAQQPSARPESAIQRFLYDPDRPVRENPEWISAPFAVEVNGLADPIIRDLRK